jgi:hypothetical protein
MSIADCLELPLPPPPPSIEIPQFGILETARESLHDLPDISKYIMSLQDVAAVALAPLRRFLELIEVIVAVMNCFNAIPDSLLPPSPGPIIDCIKALVEAFARLLAFIPPFSYLPTILDLADYAMLVIDEIVALFVLLDERITEYKSVLSNALELGDLELGAITDCASGETKVLTANLMEILKFITPLIKAIVQPISRLIPAPPIKKMLEQIADLPGTLTGIQDGIEATTGPPVLSPLLQAMYVLRNLMVVLYNVVAPIAGREANKQPEEVPTFNNF